MRKTMINARNKCVGALLGVLLLSAISWSQTVYPSSIKVPVTFYDFHSDGSNPDFEPGLHLGGAVASAQGLGLHLNEVLTTLDAQRKPLLGTTPYFSQRVAKWFRPWQSGDFTVPVYSANGNYLNDATSPTDTAYKNVVIPDSLTFTLVAGSAGVYQLSNNAFFRLDGRGFGSDDPGGQNPPHNFGYTMELHWEFTYQRGMTFNFEGDDDVWVFINGNRVIDLGGIHGPAAASVNLNNLTGMTVGQKYMLDLFYAERHVVGSDIIITTNVISANPAQLLLNMNPKVDTLPAGSFIAYNAIVKDDTGGLRHEFDPQIQWALSPTGTTSRISPTAGARDTFFAHQAYTTYIIRASYTDNSATPAKVLQAFDTVYVKAGPDYRVWIEADATIDINGTTPAMLNRLRHPAHDPLVTMTSSETQQSVVGVVRDLDGNFTHLASNSQWSEVPITTSMVSLANGSPTYIGVITRTTNNPGNTDVRVSAKSLTSGLDLIPDTTLVTLLLGYITKIKFVNAANDSELTSVNINTDQAITIKVKGVMSTDPDTNHWIDITGMWSLTNNVFSSETPLPTTSDGQWPFSPTKPGGFLPWSDASQLTVTTGSGSSLRSATIPVTVTVAPPSRVTFTITTPADSLIAGTPIHGVVSIYNKDGLVPGPYCYPQNSGVSAIYQDTLGKGATPDPTVTTKSGSGIINQSPGTTSQVAECFNGGIDTVSFTLFRAPYTSIGEKDTMHQLNVILGTISATTGPFKLLPGPLYKLQVEDVKGNHLTGTDTLKWPSGAITVYSVGYDLYGNKRGREVSNWYVTGNLHQPYQTLSISQIYYDASSVTEDEAGLLIARALRSAAINDSTGDSLGFYIKGPPSALDSAVTRDLDGNGYLDAIELHFSKPITFPPGFPLTNFTIIDTMVIGNRVVGVPFTVSSWAATDSSGMNYIVHLTENTVTLPGSPQTAWRPTVSISGLDERSVPATRCKDGAGPVIWSVVKTIVNVSDRKQDIVVVTFSEPIQGPNGSQFTPATVKPEYVLTVYAKNPDGTFRTVNTLSPFAPNGVDMLSINSFSRVINDSTLEFKMSNGKDLTIANYINITSSANQIYDRSSHAGSSAGVPPVQDNRKVQVKVVNATPNKIVAVPNPSKPIFTRPGQSPGNFSFVNNPVFRDWVREDGAGTVITFDMSPPKVAGDSIVGAIKIFDVIGNVVNQADTTIRYNSTLDTTTTITYNAYWNGSNSRGMKVAPGLYQTVVFLTYYSATVGKKLVKLWGVIGIGH